MPSASRCVRAMSHYVYSAEHGVQADGLIYLIPVGARIDTRSDIEHEAVPVQRVLNSLIEAKANPSLIILDACRDNPYRSLRSLKRGLAGFDASTLPGALIAYATSPGNVAFDGSDRNGLYTKHLLRQLRKPGLGIQQMFLEVRVAVYQETAGKQTPWGIGRAHARVLFSRASACRKFH